MSSNSYDKENPLVAVAVPWAKESFVNVSSKVTSDEGEIPTSNSGNKMSISELNAMYDSMVPMGPPLSQGKIHREIKNAHGSQGKIYYGVCGESGGSMAKASVKENQGVCFYELLGDDGVEF